jgi:hypothetical protein
LLHENGNLKDILAITEVSSEATVSRLSKEVAQIVQPSDLHQRVIHAYAKSLDRVAVGHLSIDSTIIGARENPCKIRAPKAKACKKRGRKAKGPLEEQQFRERQAQLNQDRIAYLQESRWPNWKCVARLPRSRIPRGSGNGSSATRPILRPMIMAYP